MSTVHLSGNIDHQTSTEARGRLLAELGRKGPLHVDLSGVTWIDSSGLAILVQVYLAARKVGSEVHLVKVSHDVWKKIRLAHLEGIFTLHKGNEIQSIH